MSSLASGRRLALLLDGPTKWYHLLPKFQKDIDPVVPEVQDLAHAHSVLFNP